MRKLVDFIGATLEWRQPHLTRMEYELCLGEEVIATLNFRSAFGTHATAASADGMWTFKRVGFWQPRVTVRECDAPADLAQYRNNTWSNGGTLELPDGRKYRADTNFWATKFEFRNEADEALVTYEKIGGLLHMRALVTALPTSQSLAELPWLVMLGWYLVVMMQSDAAAVAAVA